MLVSALAVVAGGVVASVTATGNARAATLPAVNTAYQLVVTKSGKCVDVPGASTTSGTKLQQWTCTDNSPWQQFTLKPAGTDVYTLAGVNSGQCVDVPSGSTTSGTQVQQWGCGTGQT
ncbi:RICIN domain-containing protein, partial [Streptomyces sp. NPDC002644]